MPFCVGSDTYYLTGFRTADLVIIIVAMIVDEETFVAYLLLPPTTTRSTSFASKLSVRKSIRASENTVKTVSVSQTYINKA